jgi:hypothetical protein
MSVSAFSRFPNILCSRSNLNISELKFFLLQTASLREESEILDDITIAMKKSRKSRETENFH